MGEMISLLSMKPLCRKDLNPARYAQRLSQKKLTEGKDFWNTRYIRSLSGSESLGDFKRY